MNKEDRSHDPWEAHRREQRRSWLRLSHAERIRWLDQAKQFVALATGAAQLRKYREGHK
jgi:hypothetical protein